MKRTNVALSVASALVASSLLTACGSSDDDPVNQPPEQANTTSSFTMSASDAPIDGASEVVLHFDSMTLVNVDSSAGDAEIDLGADGSGTVALDLLSVQGTDAAVLHTADVAAGSYNAVRFSFTEDSYIATPEGTFPIVAQGDIEVPVSITLSADGNAEYTAEFDLRSAISGDGSAGFTLHERGISVIADAEAASIQGTVSNDFYQHPNCTAKANMDVGNVVMLYQGHGHDLSALGDYSLSVTNSLEQSPVASAMVTANAEGTLAYEMGYLPAGDYTLAYSCRGDIDMPDTNEGVDDGFQVLASSEVTLASGEAAQANFDVASEMGAAKGSVDESWIVAPSCEAGMSGKYIYAFEGHGHALAELGGRYSGSANVTPVAVTAVIEEQAAASFHYEFSALATGDYTLAYTCKGDLDVAAGTEAGFEFLTSEEMTVTANGTTTADFDAETVDI